MNSLNITLNTNTERLQNKNKLFYERSYVYLPGFFLLGLCFHLLNFHGVRFAPPHKEIVIANTQV